MPGRKLLVSLVAEGDILKYRNLHLASQFFYGNEVEVFDFVDHYVASYHTLPKIQTLAEHFSDLPAAPEPSAYYADQVEQRFVYKRLNAALVDCSQHMKDKDTFTAINVISEALNQIRATQARHRLAEFSAEAHDLYMAHYEKAQLESHVEVMTGWPSLDKFGGLGPGDLLSVVGRPALGKSMCMVSRAVQGMVRNKTKSLFVSMEMPLAEILERSVAMYAHFPMDHIQKYELTTKQKTQLPAILLKAKDLPGRMWIMDGNFASTVPDVFSIVYQLNPDVLFIDGAYLMQHSDPRLDRYRRTAVNIELIKRKASEFGIPGFLSYQFNRLASLKQEKSKGKTKGGLAEIAFSDEIAQISSVVLGMFEQESVETLVAREMLVLKGRKGQVGAFHINWDFLNCDFEEIVESPQGEEATLQYT